MSLKCGPISRQDVSMHTYRNWTFVLLLGVTISTLAPGVASSQTQLNFDVKNFEVPQDKGFLPGVRLDGEADSSPEEGYDAARDVTRWEKRGRRGRVVSREVWTDRDGESRGRLAIGRPF